MGKSLTTAKLRFRLQVNPKNKEVLSQVMNVDIAVSWATGKLLINLRKNDCKSFRS